LSPAAKAYAAKQSKMMSKDNVFSDDEDDEVEMNDSPPPKVAARAPAAKPKLRRRFGRMLSVMTKTTWLPLRHQTSRQSTVAKARAKAPVKKMLLVMTKMTSRLRTPQASCPW